MKKKTEITPEQAEAMLKKCLGEIKSDKPKEGDVTDG